VLRSRSWSSNFLLELEQKFFGPAPEPGMKTLETMKIFEFFLIIWGKWSKLEPEPKFLTNWSRTKMDRLRNTANHVNHQLG
jgi:hypothetical protein